MTLSLISQLSQTEKDKFLEDYYKWCDKRYIEEFPDEYLDGYRETNEAT